MFRLYLMVICAFLMMGPAPAQSPRLLALVHVPKGTLRGWVHGQYFGIDGLWSYNDSVKSREWCWWGPGRRAFQPLPREEYIVLVEGENLTAFYQDDQDYQKCHSWSRSKNGTYSETPVPYIRRYGSDVAMNFPNYVFLPAYRQVYELFQGGLLLRRTGQPFGHPLVLRKRRIPGVTRDDILLMQPEKHKLLALGTDTGLLLLNAELHTLAKLRLGAVRNLRFDQSGERLAVVTGDDRMWILELNPRLPWNPSLDSLWRPRAELTANEFNRLADEWERKTGQLWWNPQAGQDVGSVDRLAGGNCGGFQAYP